MTLVQLEPQECFEAAPAGATVSLPLEKPRRVVLAGRAALRGLELLATGVTLVAFGPVLLSAYAAKALHEALFTGRDESPHIPL
jgi:hypothetical protein